MNIFTKVGRNVYLTPLTKAKLIGMIVGIISAIVFVTLHSICCMHGCTSDKHKLRFNMYCLDYTNQNMPENCVIDQFYMNK